MLDRKMGKKARGQLLAFAESTHTVETTPSRDPSRRIAVRVKPKIVFLDPADIVVVEASGNYVLLHHRSGFYRVRLSISDAAESFRAFGFVRIHRSFIVNSAFAEDIQALPTGEYVLRVWGGREYTVSRTYKGDLRQLATTWIGIAEPL